MELDVVATAVMSVGEFFTVDKFFSYHAECTADADVSVTSYQVKLKVMSVL